MNKNIQEMLEMMESFNQRYELYPSEKPNDSIYYIILISCVSEIITTKKFFRFNKEVVEFLEKTLKISFPAYVTKNRSLLVGRTIKQLSELGSITEVKDKLNKIYLFMDKLLEDEKTEENMTWQDVIDSLDLR